MSRENLNNGLVKIEVSQEELENSISGLEQLLPVIERLVVKGSYFSGQGKKETREEITELREHFKTAIDSMTMILLNFPEYQESKEEESISGWKEAVMRTFLGGSR